MTGQARTKDLTKTLSQTIILSTLLLLFDVTLRRELVLLSADFCFHLTCPSFPSRGFQPLALETCFRKFAFHKTSRITITLLISKLLSDCIVRRNFSPLASEKLLIKWTEEWSLWDLEYYIYKILIGSSSGAILSKVWLQNERKWLGYSDNT